MTTFTVSDSWVDQGSVNAVVTFTPYPPGVGSPVVGHIVDSVLSVDLPLAHVPEVQYAAVFTDVTLNGFAANIPPFSFQAPISPVTVSMRSVSNRLKAEVTFPLEPPALVDGGFRSVNHAISASTLSLGSSTVALTGCTQTIVVPASGKVVVTYSCWVHPTSSCQIIASCAYSDTNGVTGQVYDWDPDANAATTKPYRLFAQQIITGLTPGAHATLTPQLSSTVNDTVVNIDPAGYNCYSIIEPVY